MLCRCIDDMFIDFIRQDQQARVARHYLCNGFQVFPANQSRLGCDTRGRAETRPPLLATSHAPVEGFNVLKLTAWCVIIWGQEGEHAAPRSHNIGSSMACRRRADHSFAQCILSLLMAALHLLQAGVRSRCCRATASSRRDAPTGPTP